MAKISVKKVDNLHGEEVVIDSYMSLRKCLGGAGKVKDFVINGRVFHGGKPTPVSLEREIWRGGFCYGEPVIMLNGEVCQDLDKTFEDFGIRNEGDSCYLAVVRKCYGG